MGSGAEVEMDGGEEEVKEKVPGFDWILVWMDEEVREKLNEILKYARKVGILKPEKKWVDPVEMEEVVLKVLKHIMDFKDYDAPIKPDRAETLYHYYYTRR